MIDQITFIIASFNDEEISHSLDSLLSIVKPADEIVLVDGGSSDNTVALASAMLQDYDRHVIISEPDNGIYDAWNKALKIAQSEWLAFIGCGDVLRPDYRQKMSASITNNPDCNFIHHRAQFYTFHNHEKKYLRKFGRSFDKQEFQTKMRVCHAGALHRRMLFDDSGFSTQYKCVSDYHFLLRKIDQLKPHFIDETLIEMKAGGISSDPIIPYREELIMKLELGLHNKFLLRFRYYASVLKAALFLAADRARLAIEPNRN